MRDRSLATDLVLLSGTTSMAVLLWNLYVTWG